MTMADNSLIRLHGRGQACTKRSFVRSPERLGKDAETGVWRNRKSRAMDGLHEA